MHASTTVANTMACSSVVSTIRQVAAALGYATLKEEQERVISAFVTGRDVFVALPTGFGKSLCFTILPHVFDSLKNVENQSIAMVVSPLVALMKDQVAAFTEKGITAAYVSDKESTSKETRRSVKRGECQLVILSPEALFSTLEWRRMLCTQVYRENLIGFIVDEAHCVKKWGDGFRQEFSHLGEIRSIIPEHVRVMALTATATNATRVSIIKTLNMQKPVIISIPPIKHNIIYAVAEKSTVFYAFIPLAERLSEQRTQMGRIIIFCRKYDEVTSIYHFFKHKLGPGFTEPEGAPDLAKYRLVDMFTLCCHKSVKDIIVKQFTTVSPLRIIIATVAFGMGIDCHDVRQVIHWGIPEDAEMWPTKKH